MKNWSTDINALKKEPDAYAIWKLEQQVNFGLDGEKIKESDLRKYWDRLQVDPARREFLKILLYV
ncbi:hypothetical protein EPN81_00725 [Patescibacteria group bacterium]|nr:MAG: hypothetical protein EPN81_00725 [Patescibacteria group bacterium]